MNRILCLDSGPLGLLTHPQRTAEVIEATTWITRCLRAGDQIVVPAIIYFELKRELLRVEKTSGIARLDAFISATPGRYLPLTDGALHLAAELWATARRQGRPTADPKALDIDVILAAQVIPLGPEAAIATTNAKHLAQFITAKHWRELEP